MSDDAQIDFTVIGGFLGSGKTSLVNRILTQDSSTRFAVMVNDFGALNIDAELIVNRQGEGKVMQLSNGCICCSLAGGMVDALLELMAYRQQIDHILIEASGVSNPSRIMDFARIDGDLRPRLTLVLVDAAGFKDQWADSRLAETLSDQLASADLFLLTKTDIARAEDCLEVKAILTHNQGNVPIMILDKDNANLTDFLGFGHQDEAPIIHPPHHHEHSQHDFNSIGFIASGPIDKAKFMALCEAHSGVILRGKGVVDFGDGVGDGAMVWQQTGRLIDLTPTSPPNREGESKLVIIGVDDLADVRSAFIDLGFSAFSPS